jgi:hypothetical protein
MRCDVTWRVVLCTWNSPNTNLHTTMSAAAARTTAAMLHLLRLQSCTATVHVLCGVE